MSDRIERIRLKQLEIISKAKEALPKNEYGGVDEEQLIEALVATLPFDIDAARRRQAVKMVDAATRPGGGHRGRAVPSQCRTRRQMVEHQGKRSGHLCCLGG